MRIQWSFYYTSTVLSVEVPWILSLGPMCRTLPTTKSHKQHFPAVDQTSLARHLVGNEWISVVTWTTRLIFYSRTFRTRSNLITTRRKTFLGEFPIKSTMIITTVPPWPTGWRQKRYSQIKRLSYWTFKFIPAKSNWKYITKNHSIQSDRCWYGYKGLQVILATE